MSFGGECEPDARAGDRGAGREPAHLADAAVRVSDWARVWAVEAVLGIDANQLNDDRLARALDGIAPKLEQTAGTVGARAITGFGIDVRTWDLALRPGGPADRGRG